MTRTYVNTVIPMEVPSTANLREHWGQRAARARSQRRLVAARLATFARPPTLAVEVLLIRVAPRALDSDNLRSALKAVRDSVASWLGASDGPNSPIVWSYGSERHGALRAIGIVIRARPESDGEHASDLHCGEGLAGPTKPVLPRERGAHALEGQARATKLPSPRDGLGLVSDRDQRAPVGADREAEGYAAHPLTTRALGLKRGSRSRGNEPAFVSGERIDDARHEPLFGRVAADPIRRGHHRASGPGERLDRCPHEKVSCEATPLCHDEAARAVRGDVGEGEHETRSLTRWGRPAHMVDVPCHDCDPLAPGPRLDRIALRVDTVRLVARARTQVGHALRLVAPLRRFSHGGWTRPVPPYSNEPTGSLGAARHAQSWHYLNTVTRAGERPAPLVFQAPPPFRRGGYLSLSSKKKAPMNAKFPRPRKPTKAPVKHDADGVVQEAPKRRVRTEEEIARAAVIQVERLRQSKVRLNFLEKLSPSGPSGEGETLRDTGVLDISGARPAEPALLEIPRASGTGGPGTSLVIRGRFYDGLAGREADDYLVLYTAFADNGGFACRSRGTAVRRNELRAVAAALLAFADRLDSEKPLPNAPEKDPGSLA